MNNKQLWYILHRTIHESILWIIYGIDFLLPDFTILSPLRKLIRWSIGSIWRWTRIRKWQYFTHVNKCKIWSWCFINRGNIFDNGWWITIWNNCSIWYKNTFITASHFEKGDQNYSWSFTTHNKAITIGNNVWIATNCTILPWVNIWDNCIIGSWAIVNKDCEPNSIYAGVPAKKIRETEWFISKAM